MALQVGDHVLVLKPGQQSTFTPRWHSRWVVKRARHPTYWVTHTPTGQDKVLHRSWLQHVPADINWTKEKSQESSRMVDPGTMESPPMAPPTARPPLERSDKTSPPPQPDTPTPTTPMVRADPPLPPAADIATGTYVSTPAAPPLVRKFSRKDRPGVTTRNQGIDNVKETLQQIGNNQAKFASVLNHTYDEIEITRKQLNSLTTKFELYVSVMDKNLRGIAEQVYRWTLRCYGCGRVGHMRRECRQSRAGNGQKS